MSDCRPTDNNSFKFNRLKTVRRDSFGHSYAMLRRRGGLGWSPDSTENINCVFESLSIVQTTLFWFAAAGAAATARLNVSRGTPHAGRIRHGDASRGTEAGERRSLAESTLGSTGNVPRGTIRGNCFLPQPQGVSRETPCAASQTLLDFRHVVDQ